ncbi:MAG: nuclear transport factor 2 family protein, partial [Vulcanimicrobiota bacterium]
MTHLLSVLSLVLGLTLSGVCQERDAMLQFQLSDQLKQSATRWNNGDLEGFLQDYHQSPDMTFTSGGRILKGFEALEQRYRKSYGDQPGSMGNLTFSDFEAWRLGPDQALVLGRWTLKREQ